MESVANEKARKIVSQFPKTNKTSLARMLFDNDPITFKNVEAARSSIRYVTGTKGSKMRGDIKDKSNIETGKKNKNIWGLMGEMHNDVTPYVLPKSSKKIGVLSDIHMPYQDNNATRLALNYLKEKQVDTIVLNGDVTDCYQISRWDRDPGKRDFKYELDATRLFLESIKKEFPKALIIFKEGNHEERWIKFLLNKAPEVFNMSEFRLDVILGLAPMGIQWVDNKRIIKVGKLNVLHGHEYYGAYSPVNPAKGYFNKALANVMAGHNHQSSEHISKDLNDNISGAWSLGCLCELHPNYMPYNKWNHGFAMVTVEDDNGNFNVVNKKIINGKLL